MPSVSRREAFAFPATQMGLEPTPSTVTGWCTALCYCAETALSSLEGLDGFEPSQNRDS